ncbi:AAA domain-containing protein [Trichoderma velutinum]
MSRVDLYCVWGNILSPCFLFDDPKQLPPTVLTPNEKDGDSNFLNRLTKGGDVSALLFFQASGIPKRVTHVYATSCNIATASFDSGKALENYIQEKYPTVTSSPECKLLPVFIHAPGARVHTDDTTVSKRSNDQPTAALDFAVDLVKSKNIDPSKIVVIAPYAANVDLLDYMIRKKPAYKELKGIPPPSTVDSFQGQENDIVIVVMGTAPKPGPGFTTHEQRLNVMLTWHRFRCSRCSVVVDSMNVTGELVDDEGNDLSKANFNDKHFS